MILNEPTSWLILTPPAPYHPLSYQLNPIISMSIATLHLVPSPWCTTILVQDIITRLNHSINTRKRNRMPRLLFAKYLLRNKWFLVPKFKINEAKPRKWQEHGCWNQTALVWTQPCYLLSVWPLQVIRFLWGWFSYKTGIIIFVLQTFCKNRWQNLKCPEY